MGGKRKLRTAAGAANHAANQAAYRKRQKEKAQAAQLNAAAEAGVAAADEAPARLSTEVIF